MITGDDEIWTHYPEFPRFMAHVREVRELGDGRSYWVAQGPAGVTATWVSVVTRMIPNELLAWRTEPGSAVAYAGIIRFERANGNSTRIQIRLTYHPPAGAPRALRGTTLRDRPEIGPQ